MCLFSLKKNSTALCGPSYSSTLSIRAMRWCSLKSHKTCWGSLDLLFHLTLCGSTSEKWHKEQMMTNSVQAKRQLSRRTMIWVIPTLLPSPSSVSTLKSVCVKSTLSRSSSSRQCIPKARLVLAAQKNSTSSVKVGSEEKFTDAWKHQLSLG